MKIEKKILRKSEKLSNSAKAAIAASLGVAASFALSACVSDASEVNSEESKNSEHTCGMVACDEDLTSNSSSESIPSSSNKVIDIPLSGEHYSSSSIEALSSAARLSAMRPTSSSITAGIPHVYSSPTVPPSSSSITTPPLAGDIIPIEHSSSSSATQPSSSSANDETIKKNPEIDSILIPIDIPTNKDTLIPQIHLCDDPINPNCHMLIQSMVTTLETDDIA